MIEPSSENPLNIEAYSLYIAQPQLFDSHAQLSLRGGWISGVLFPANTIPSFSKLRNPINNRSNLNTKRSFSAISSYDSDVLGRSDPFSSQSTLRDSGNR